VPRKALDPGDKFLDAVQAAELIGFSRNTFIKMVMEGEFPVPYMKIGNKYRFRRKDMEAVIDTLTVNGSFDPSLTIKPPVVSEEEADEILGTDEDD